MNRVQFANCSHVIVDVCKPHGTWFDRDELRRIVELAQQAFHLGARLGDVDVEVAAQDEIQRVADQRIVIDDQQFRFDL